MRLQLKLALEHRTICGIVGGRREMSNESDGTYFM